MLVAWLALGGGQANGERKGREVEWVLETEEGDEKEKGRDNDFLERE